MILFAITKGGLHGELALSRPTFPGELRTSMGIRCCTSRCPSEQTDCDAERSGLGSEKLIRDHEAVCMVE